ncbi:MAG: hypothetical protein M1368_05775 [Thaumarchaeota archaeon]|nr:hypothetical protein [Nitrososphaerota archaeon]
MSIVPLEDIKPHEATIPSLLDSLKRDIKRTGSQRDPILIDRRTRMALDGMHRRKALLALKAKFAVCSEFDYLNSKVKLERWLRYLIAPDRKTVEKIVDMFQMRRLRTVDSAILEVDSAKNCFALLNSRASFVSKSAESNSGVYQNIDEADRIFENAQVEVSFAGDKERRDLYSSESVYVLYPAPLKKKDVLSVAGAGSVFPYKTTRHIVPLRPMGLYFPLDMLTNSSKEECERELERIVKSSKISVEERDVWYEGRRYSEPIAVFRTHS